MKRTRESKSLFVCLTMNAFRIEGVSDLSTDAFITAPRKEVERRDFPTEIFCKTGTTLVLANSKLKELKTFLFGGADQNHIVNSCSYEFINFHFTLPSHGYAVVVGASKTSSKRRFNQTPASVRLTYQELVTALTEIQAILNSRTGCPLTLASSYESTTISRRAERQQTNALKV